ncbi:glycosyltransferase family 4 protein [Limnofasciculus baicalensis]|uniref:Glycosyltransferase family 4 protein n=1 Tax=Limnofasciculus baicalensis BBK-W-15 TaxID=2699891 RepID=A0AAE3GP56_9CYAN|nr:glycosyltransferase family 4 protein [Limnofasciculus baicalensis]MCP2727569.1 glycosyltransferase family 4 protein [Limnofasciculus baicalensis BBK-W-15]
MKIAFADYPYIPADPPKSGAVRLVSYALAGRLVSLGHEVLFYGAKAPYHQTIESVEEGIRYRRITASWIDSLLEPLNYLDEWNLSNPQRPFYASKWFYCSAYGKMVRDLQRQQCDVIHLHIAFQFVPMMRAFNPQAKIVFHAHSELLPQFDLAFVKHCLSSADLVLGCSDYITNPIRKYLPEIPCQTLYNGFDLHHFTPQPRRNYRSQTPKQILFVGRISPEKGVHVLIDAFNQVVSRYPNVELKLVGPENALLLWYILSRNDPKTRSLMPFFQGNYRQIVQDRISKNAENSVFFLSRIPHEKMIEYYQQSDLFVFPSVWEEPFGMPVIEAIAMELPVIATRGGAFPEIVEEEKTGLLVERGDANALAEAILHLLRDENISQ